MHVQRAWALFTLTFSMSFGALAFAPFTAQAQEGKQQAKATFNCAAGMQTLINEYKNIKLAGDETDRTIIQLQNFIKSTLEVESARPNLQALFFNSDATEEKPAIREAIAGRLSSILLMDENREHTDLIFSGLTIHGREDIQNYFKKLRKTANDFHEAVYRLPPQNDPAWIRAVKKQSDLITAGALLGIGVGLNSTFSDTVLSETLYVSAMTVFSYLVTAVSSMEIERSDPDFFAHLQEFENFAAREETGQRYIFESIQQKVLPKTIEQAWMNRQVQEWQLFNEHNSPVSGRVPNPFPDWISGAKKLNTVAIDYLLDSWGDGPNDMALHVFVRADRSKFNTPSKPKRVKEKTFVPTVAPSYGQLQPVPVPVRSNNQAH